LRDVVGRYHARGFTVCDIHGDQELECVRVPMRPIEINVVPADSHVGEVERSIRTMKERLRSMAHGMPYKRLPQLMITHMVADTVRCLNQFPWKNGISSILSPASIVTGVGNPDYNKMRLEFGAYVQLFEDNAPSNTFRSRSLGAIALTPTGNAQGDYFFMSLATGKRISRHAWTVLPIPDTAIARVEKIALNEGQPLLQSSGLVVEWRPDQPIDDSEYDVDYAPPQHAPAEEGLPPAAYAPIDAAEVADLLDDGPHPYYDPVADIGAGPGAVSDGDDEEDDDYDDYDDDDDDNSTDLNFHGANQHGDNANDGDQEGALIDNPVGYDSTDDTDFPAAIEATFPTDGDVFADATDNNDFADAAANDAPAEQGASDGQAAGAQGAPYGLRPRSAKPAEGFRQAMDAPHNNQSYFPPKQFPTIGHSLAQRGYTFKMTPEFENSIFGYVLNQMTAKAGIKKHGKAAEAALMKEFAQLEALDVYESVDPKSLTKEQRHNALRAINLIKEKRDGVLKGRTVADGRAQRSIYPKSQTASPTVGTDALLLSIMIDAYENRDVATADVVGAYLKAFMDDFVLMKFTGDSVDILCEMNPEHVKNTTFENGTKVLYVRLIKAIYGCVKSALLWYELFHGHLKDMGFALNPYDPCVANCTIEGKQCTIAWYVDDTKISHVNPEVVTSVIDQIEERFDKMTVTRGREHTFLGMKIRYTGEGTAIITMKQYLEEALAESEMHISRTAVTPATRNLFEVDPDSPRLDKHRAEVLHSVTAKLLYVSLRARVDLLLAVVFLCTRVSVSTEQDEAKLRRVLEYINGSIADEYVLGADDMGRMRSWVDASFAVHPGMRSHTGGVISFGRGGLVCKSMKHKSVELSSTGAELVGASNYLPNTLWVKQFLEAQGHHIHESFFEQDNESAIRMETNGRMSAGAKSRHINIRYFWIKDQTKDANITVRHCPTLEMLADFFTKPLQGELFKKFKAVLLGHAHVNTLAMKPMVSAEERVGKGRSNPKGITATGVVDTGTSNSTVPKNVTGKENMNVTWADVVRTKAPKAATSEAMKNSVLGDRKFVSKIILSKQSRY
jgi:hypothetical protein